MKKAPVNEKEKASGKVLATRILAIALAVLMVVGIAYYTIFMIADSIKAKNNANKEDSKTEESDTNHDGHDHDDGSDDTGNDKGDW